MKHLWNKFIRHNEGEVYITYLKKKCTWFFIKLDNIDFISIISSLIFKYSFPSVMYLFSCWNKRGKFEWVTPNPSPLTCPRSRSRTLLNASSTILFDEVIVSTSACSMRSYQESIPNTLCNSYQSQLLDQCAYSNKNHFNGSCHIQYKQDISTNTILPN